MLTVGLCFFQAEDGIRDLVRSGGLGDVYKRQDHHVEQQADQREDEHQHHSQDDHEPIARALADVCLLYTSDAADERSSVDLGGRRIIKKKRGWTLAGRRTPSKDAWDTQSPNCDTEAGTSVSVQLQQWK